MLLRAPKAQQRDPDRPAEPWMEHLELVRDALFRLRDVPMAFHFSPRDFRKVYCKLDLETKKYVSDFLLSHIPLLLRSFITC